MTHYPRSSTELFAHSLPLSLKQREVMDVLATFPTGATASQVAHSLNMHVNTARGHLDELIAAGVVRAATASSSGRGRPSLIFHVRVPDNRAVAQEYLTLIELMVEMLATTGTVGKESLQQAEEIGRRWAQSTVHHAVGNDSPPGHAGLHPREFLLSKMRDMGFDPVLTPGTLPEKNAATRKNSAGTTKQDITLHACPFITATKSPSSFVCAVHAGFLAEVSRTVYKDQTLLKLHPGTHSAACLITEETGT